MWVCCKDDAEFNGHVASDAEHRGILVNAVDMPDFGNNIFPSIVDRSPLVIAIGCGGTLADASAIAQSTCVSKP